MITLTPLTGYKFITPFTVSISPSAADTVINWGDGNFSNTSTATHIYSAANLYTIYAGNCASTSSFNITAYNGGFYQDKIIITYNSLSSIASCPNTFTLHISSDTPTATVFLYSSGSNSYPYNTDRIFWSHLNPEWRFTDLQGNAISEITISGTPIYDINNNLLGYSAMSSVMYYDDMPGSPNLFFTILEEQCQMSINSRAYAALSGYRIVPDVPVRLLITADGLNPINEIQWADLSNPYVVSVQGLCACNTIMYYASGYLTTSRPNQLCFGVASTDYDFALSAINLTDADCFNTGGYIINHFTLPASSIPANAYSNDANEFTCITKTPDEITFSVSRQSPYVQLSATANIVVNGVTYNLSGLSNPFYVHKLENFHNFYRKGEDKTPYDFIKQASHFNFDEYPIFDTYLSSIAGSGDSLGKVYDKIANLNKDLSDIDICGIDSIYDISKKMDIDLDDYGLTFPEELKRLMNFFSIPLEKLIGTRCVCNSQFLCTNCCGKNICGLCGFNKRTNLGDQLSFTDYVTAGQTILIRERHGDVYDFYPIYNTTQVKDISGLNVLDYCFFKWNDFHQGNPIEGVVDYTNPNTTLSKTLTSSQDWYENNGVIEEMINYTLTKNLL
jgi:hypothetical protein